MARIIRSPLAKRDISNVLRFTIDRWGKAQATIYRELIRDALEAIVADPSCGSERFTVRDGVRGYHIKRGGGPARHIVFYRVNAAGDVEVIGCCTTRWTSIGTFRNLDKRVATARCRFAGRLPGMSAQGARELRRDRSL